jgi:ketosteroid isomerase-like protein
MSQENVEMVRRSIEMFNRGDLDALFRDADPEIEWHDQPELPGATVHHGAEAAAEHRGRICSVRIFGTRAEALEAAGLWD